MRLLIIFFFPVIYAEAFKAQSRTRGFHALRQPDDPSEGDGQAPVESSSDADANPEEAEAEGRPERDANKADADPDEAEAEGRPERDANKADADPETEAEAEGRPERDTNKADADPETESEGRQAAEEKGTADSVSEAESTKEQADKDKADAKSEAGSEGRQAAEEKSTGDAVPRAKSKVQADKDKRANDQPGKDGGADDADSEALKQEEIEAEEASDVKNKADADPKKEVPSTKEGSKDPAAKGKRKEAAEDTRKQAAKDERAADGDSNELGTTVDRARDIRWQELFWEQVVYTHKTMLPGLEWSLGSIGLTSGGLILASVWFLIYFGFMYLSDRNQDWAAHDKVIGATWRPHGAPFSADPEANATRHLDVRPDMVIVFRHPEHDYPDDNEVKAVEDLSGVFTAGMTATATKVQQVMSRSSRSVMETTLMRTRGSIAAAKPRKEFAENTGFLDKISGREDEQVVKMDNVRMSLMHDMYDALHNWGFDVLVFSSVDEDELFFCISCTSEQTIYHYLEAFHARLQIKSCIASRLGCNFSGWELEAASSPPYVRFDSRLVDILSQCKVRSHHKKEKKAPKKEKKAPKKTVEEDVEQQAPPMPDKEEDEAPGTCCGTALRKLDMTAEKKGEGSNTTTLAGDTCAAKWFMSEQASWMKEEAPEAQEEPAADEGARIISDADPRLLWRTFHGGTQEGGCVVDSRDRLLIVHREICNHIDLNGAKEIGLIADWYPVHNLTSIEMLRAEWARLDRIIDFTFVQPITVIDEYFGPRLAFRFAWCGVYCKSLVALLPLALICESGVLLATWFGAKGVDRMVIVSFNLIIIMWTKIAFNLWEREEHFFKAMWGLEHMTAEETGLVRPQFIGVLAPSDHDRSIIQKRYPSHKLLLRKAFTFSVTLLFCLVVWGLISFWFRLFHGSFSLLTAVLLSLQMKGFEIAWNAIAPLLTEFENHKYPNEFFNSYLAKLFAFQAINSYAPFVYTAVNMRLTESGCPAGGCLALLRYQLILIQILMSVSYVVSILIEVYSVDFSLWYEGYKARKKAQETTATGEISHVLTDGFDTRVRVSNVQANQTESFKALPERSYAEQQSKHADFGDRQQIEAMCMLMISLGSIIIFGSVAPIMVPFCLVVFTLELRFTAYALTTHAKRPLPRHRIGIGAWKDVLKCLMVMGIVFSAFLLVTYSDTFQGAAIVTRCSAAVCFMFVSLVIWEILNFILPPTDPRVRTLEGRRARVEQKLRVACHEEVIANVVKPRRFLSGTYDAATHEKRYDEIKPLFEMTAAELYPHLAEGELENELSARSYEYLTTEEVDEPEGEEEEEEDAEVEEIWQDVA